MWWRSTNTWTDRTSPPALVAAPVAPRRRSRSAGPAFPHPPAQLTVAALACARCSGSTEPGPRRAGFARIGVVTSGTELAAAGIDLLVRDLVGHTRAETTPADVHLAPELIAAE
jgi:hypothetical protein